MMYIGHERSFREASQWVSLLHEGGSQEGGVMELTRSKRVLAFVGNITLGLIAVGILVFAIPTTMRAAIDQSADVGKRAPIRAGDICYRCQRPILDRSLAAEGIGAAGVGVRKFRTLACMLKYLNQSGEGLDVLVTDWSSGRLVRARWASFVPTVIDTRTGEGSYVAFQYPGSASWFAANTGATPMGWEAVQASERVHSMAP